MSTQRFNVGSGESWSVGQGLEHLKSLVYDLSHRLSLFGHTLQRLSNAASSLEHVFGRLTAAGVLLAGFSLRPGTASRASGGTEGGGGFPGWAKVEEDSLASYRRRKEAEAQVDEEFSQKWLERQK
jgi:hypothetical protein